MPHNKYIWLAVVILILLLPGCTTRVENTPEETLSTQVPQPTWEFEQDIRIRGVIVSADQVKLSFPISGHVLELFVEDGDSVHEGDEIARIDTTNLIAGVATAEGALTVAQKNLQQVLAGPHEAQIAEAELEITAVASRLSLTNAMATEQASDMAIAQARLDYLLAQPLPENVAVAQAEVTRARINVETARARLSQASLVAPMEGTVTEVFINAHEYANVGQPVVQISDLANLNMEVILDDLEMSSIDNGDILVVTFEAFPGADVEGHVVSIKPNEMGDRERNFIALIELHEIPEGLRWGMTAEVLIP